MTKFVDDILINKTWIYLPLLYILLRKQDNKFNWILNLRVKNNKKSDDSRGRLQNDVEIIHVIKSVLK